MTDRARRGCGLDAREHGGPELRATLWIRPSTLTRCTLLRASVAAPFSQSGLSYFAHLDLSYGPCSRPFLQLCAPLPGLGPAAAVGPARTGCSARSATTVLTGMAPARRLRMRRCGRRPGHGCGWSAGSPTGQRPFPARPAPSPRLTSGGRVPCRRAVPAERRAEGVLHHPGRHRPADPLVSGEFVGAVGDLTRPRPGCAILDMSRADLLGLVRAGRAGHRAAADQATTVRPE